MPKPLPPDDKDEMFLPDEAEQRFQEGLRKAFGKSAPKMKDLRAGNTNSDSHSVIIVPKNPLLPRK